MQMSGKRKRKVSPVGLLIVAFLLLALVLLSVFGVFGSGNTQLSCQKLPCTSIMDVTPFGNRILYYDGSTLYCIDAGGKEYWKQMIGSGAGFHASENAVAAWTGNQLYIFDRNGNKTFNDHMSATVQFARVGEKYVAAVLGENISPELMIYDLKGLYVDSEGLEKSTYQEMLILDVGFFSDGEYMWSTALDVYGTVPSVKMYIIRVGQMNTGEISLGESLPYSVVFSGNKLNVVTTRQLTQYDYRGTQADNGTVLVYGWTLIDHSESSGEAQLLFSTTAQTATGEGLSTLRYISGKTDTQYSLPSSCVGGTLYRNRLYAFAGENIYRCALSDRRFTVIGMPMDEAVTDYLGRLNNGTVLLACGMNVYAVGLR